MTGRERLKDIANKWCQWVGPEGDRERYHEIGNAALEALAHREQLHALALQNVRLREALERVIAITEADNIDSYMLNVHEAERVLAIGKPQAARDVAEWRRDSERLTQMIDASNNGHGIIDDGTWGLTPIHEDDAQVALRVAIDAAIDAARRVK